MAVSAPASGSTRRHTSLLDGLDAPDMAFELQVHDLVRLVRGPRA